MSTDPRSESARSRAPVAIASVGGVLYWGVVFYVTHLPWLLAVAAPAAASRVAFSLWAERLPGLLWTAIELVVVVFRIGLVVVVVGLARGTGETIPGVPTDWLPEVLETVERSFEQWPTVLAQLFVVSVVFLAVNVGVTHAAVPWLASTAGEDAARAAAFAFKNLVVIPLFVVFLYGIVVRQFA